jgi:hypothetical protein
MPMHPRMLIIRMFCAAAVVFGLLLTYNLFIPPKDRIFGQVGTYLMFFGPLLLAAGALKFITELHRTREAGPTHAPSATSSTPAFASKGARKLI